MKKYLIIFCLGLVSLSSNLFAENVTAYFTYSTFSIPSKGPFIETYISVIGNSLKFVKNANGKFQGAVDITVGFKQNGEIKSAQKYTLNSPEIDDTTKGFPNFIDQQRYSLPNGSYDLELTIADKNKPSEKPFFYTTPISINFPTDIMAISSIELLESYTKSANPTVLTKSGYDLTPYVSNFFPQNINKIKFYAEMYNSKKIIGEGEKMLISYYIESSGTKTRLNSFSLFSKQTTDEVNVLLGELNIESLPSGNYNIVVEVRDKDNKIQAEERSFFQRANKAVAQNFDDLKSLNVSTTFVSFYKNADTLGFYIRSLRPISSSSEVQYEENQLKGKELILMQQFFYNFWKSRYPTNTEAAWLSYFDEVKKANADFGTYSLRGFDTDRGRVYLQYGPPDIRNKYDTEPSAIPYEIWEYYSLNDKSQMLSDPFNKQSTRKFVFYNPDLVSNKYTLIHSDARGEVNNYRWDLLIHNRDTQSSNIDDSTAPSHYGGNSTDNYNNPH